jgi:hypothetical protein
MGLAAPRIALKSAQAGRADRQIYSDRCQIWGNAGKRR